MGGSGMRTFASRHKPAPGAGSAASAGRGRALPAPRLTSPTDASEREADRLADQLMRPSAAVLPRTSSSGRAFPDSRSATTAAPAIVRDALSSPGRPLPPAVRAAMEPRFRQDLGRVRLRADARAAASAAALGAAAYTVGSDIVFGAGAASPDTNEGRRLLAHELVHVVQQTGGPHRSPAGSPGAPITSDRSGRIARQPKPAEPAAPPTLAELNGWPMESILARLNELAEAPLLALKNEAKTVKGLNAPRLQLALDVVWTKKFSRATLPEFEAILPGQMEVVIPVLQNADQQAAIRKFLMRPRKPKPTDAGALAAALGAGEKPIPSSQLKAFGSDEQTAFKRQVYEAHIAAAARVRKFSMGVAAADLVSIGGGQQLRKDAAPDMIALLAKAKEDLKAAQDAGDALAQSVKSIGVGNSYRDTKQDFGLWDGYFKQYYDDTRKDREAADGGEHGAKAVAIMVALYTGSKAAPGFSNHTSGIAVDFTTTEGKDTLGSLKSQNARWKKSWLHQWLVANAATYNYEPLSTEAFHWSHKMSEPAPAEPPHK
jgi:hypothetical protein